MMCSQRAVLQGLNEVTPTLEVYLFIYNNYKTHAYQIQDPKTKTTSEL